MGYLNSHSLSKDILEEWVVKTGSNVQGVGILRSETMALGQCLGDIHGSEYLRWGGKETHAREEL